MNCEKCGAAPKGFDLFDYCAECSRNLCPDCMAKGCCGHVPALSGTEHDDDPWEGVPEEKRGEVSR